MVLLRRVEALHRLRKTGEKLPEALRREILALGPDAVPALVSMLDDESLDDGPGEGWPPIHAVGLLADLKAVEAIGPMLDVLAATDWEQIIHDRVILRLPELGAPVLEPVLARLEDLDDEELLETLVGILARLGVKDERIFERIVEAWENNPAMIAASFADYGDPRALSLLREAILAFEPDFTRRIWRFDLTEFVEAYTRLGGIIDPAIGERVDAIDAAAKDVISSHARSAKVGRNEPCPCGSGKKFKKCCLSKAAAG